MREDTELKNFLIYCPKCKQETFVDVSGFIYCYSILTVPNIAWMFLRGKCRTVPMPG
ncbi:cysteine-rich KTR domain-containing protein [Lachnospiraceae bacterium 29-84]